MTYVGAKPATTFAKATSQTFTGDNSDVTFTLNTRVSNPEDLEVFVSNIQQQPTTSYTIDSDGVTLRFSEAPPSGQFYVVYRHLAQQTGTDTGASRLVGNNTFTGTNTFNADVSFPDNVKATFGTGDDLEIKHNGNNSFITDTGSGNLYIQATNSVFLRNASGNKTSLQTNDGGSVDLYHNNSKKFETTSAGALITGSLDMNGGELILDADGDTSITADTDDRIDFRTAGSDRMKINSNGSVGIGSDVTTSDLNIGKGLNSNYTGIQFTSPNTATGTIINFGDSTDNDYSSITAFASNAGENGRMRFIAGTNEGMNIDSSGRVLKPDQPGFMIGLSGGHVTTNGVVPFNNAYFNTGGHFNTSTGVFTAPVTGVYQFNAFMLLQVNMAAGYYYWSYTYNGSALSYCYEYMPTANFHRQYQLSICYKMNANDTMSVYNHTGHWYGTATQHSQFSGYLLG